MEFLEGIPDILYKYRDWSNPYNKRLLTHKELYFASFDQFNDPFDGTIPYRYNPADLTDDKIFLKYYQTVKRDKPKLSDEKIHEICFKHQQRGLLKDEVHLKQFTEESKKMLNDTFGIVSLTTEQNNFLMWSHYSGSHSGFCVGFDKFLLFEQCQGGISKITYQEEIPFIELYEEVHSLFDKLIFTKSKTWEYENEFRLHKAHFSRKALTLIPDTFAEIILGCKMEFTEKTNLLALFKKEFPNTRVYETTLHDKNFKLVVNRLM